MGDEIGEGGRVFSRPGMYGNAWDGDIASQHPSSAIAEVLFGVLYTKRFEEIKEARVAIKHHDYYDNMVTEAVKTISQYGDFEWFVSDDPYVPDTPPWQEPSEPWNDRTPYDVR